MKRTVKLTTSAAALALGLSVLGNWNGVATYAQTPAPAAAKAVVPLTGTWTIDPLHTNVNFAVKHMGISTVRGRFNDVAGTIVADAAHPEKSSVQVTIQTKSVNTNVDMRDNHLRTPDFFDAEKYPEITFKSTRIQKGRKGGFVAVGNLTMHGITKEVSLPFQIGGPVADGYGGHHIGLETSTRLNRQDYGIKFGQVLDNGALSVGNDVDVAIGLEAIPAAK